MGAAAVFETAAETPPTVDKELATASLQIFFCQSRRHRAQRSIAPGPDGSCVAKAGRTQEIDHEALSSC
jgi:hypothetical protein